MKYYKVINKKMRYKRLEPISKNEVENILKEQTNEYILAETLFRMVYHIDDSDFVEKHILIFANKKLFEDRIIISISDFVRIHNFLPESLKKLLVNYKKEKNLT
jgi:hypothetical protein